MGIVRPTPLKLADGSFLRGVVKVVAATHHSVLMAEGGAVYSFGRGDDGRLGLGDESHFRGEQSGQKHRSLPTLLQAFAYDSGKCVLAKGDVIVDISCGENHGLAASKEGKLYTWGDGDLLQNGTGEFEAEWTPRHITSQQITTFPRKVVQVCGGSQHSFILAEDPHNAQPSK